MMKLVIINGYPASGKSTLAFKYAKEHNFALIIQDHFLFKMNPSSLKTKKPNGLDHEIALINILSCLENYMSKGKNIVVEGALVSISNDNPMHISHFIKLSKKYKYKTIIISLIASNKVRKRRQIKRGNTLLARTDSKLVNANNLLNLTIDSHRVDTTKLSIKKSIEEIDQIIHK